MSDLAPHWSWRFADAAGREIDRPTSPTFVGRFDAEEWFGLHWRALRDQGAAAAVLRLADATVGPSYDLRAVPEEMTFTEG
ncbi:hypothetical protein [Cellulomonas sp. RIT-PI-Y]|jgi:hypothetical protein|uniref:hypothetical protein n=1 Tax=Cellulomonas sp. RIT-PI-Y TaxID=3035297 RepID=UPI0021DA32BC|nr:hypothetical protein [Cellulomonas sp. RIT-PI-Y]